MRRCVLRVAAALAITVATPAPALAAAGDPGSTASAGVTAHGTSREGRALRVAHRCADDATVEVLVVGAIHGNETAGRDVVRRLGHARTPVGTCLHLLTSINPDGVAHGTRQNARGVDLNRNFPFEWRGEGRAFDMFYPGRSRASEPETRAALAMVRAIDPDVTIWYHQQASMTIRPPLPWRVALARTYAQVSRLAMREYTIGGRLHGTASSWQHAEQPSSLALVIELPAGRLSAASVARHVAAVRAVAAAARVDRPDVP